MPETQKYLTILNHWKPVTTRRNLLVIAALVWTFAGGMLLFKGSKMLPDAIGLLSCQVSFSLISGIIFYRVLFSKISLKHITRIILLRTDRPCLFSFFSFRSYFLMALMISMGVYLRKSGIIPEYYLSILYLTMGIPLFVSAFRFYHSAIFYRIMVTRFGGKQ
jgi:hypothetical protein